MASAARPVSTKPSASAWSLACRLFEAQWPAGKAPTPEWRPTASKKEWHELTDVMTQPLLAEDLNLPLTGLCFLGLVLLLALDYYYLWVAPSLVINILLVAPGIVLTRVSVGPASSK